MGGACPSWSRVLRQQIALTHLVAHMLPPPGRQGLAFHTHRRAGPPQSHPSPAAPPGQPAWDLLRGAGATRCRPGLPQARRRCSELPQEVPLSLSLSFCQPAGSVRPGSLRTPALFSSFTVTNGSPVNFPVPASFVFLYPDLCELGVLVQFVLQLPEWQREFWGT